MRPCVAKGGTLPRWVHPHVWGDSRSIACLTRSSGVHPPTHAGTASTLAPTGRPVGRRRRPAEIVACLATHPFSGKSRFPRQPSSMAGGVTATLPTIRTAVKVPKPVVWSTTAQLSSSACPPPAALLRRRPHLVSGVVSGVVSGAAGLFTLGKRPPTELSCLPASGRNGGMPSRRKCISL